MALEPPKPFEDQEEHDFDKNQEPDEEDLTFEEICPVWSDRIRNWDQLTVEEQRDLKIILKYDGARCFLGEAWGWKNDWGRSQYDGCVCGMCKDFGEVMTSNSMVNPFISFTRVNEPDIKAELSSDEQITASELYLETFEQRKSAFVDHWNKYHRKTKC